MSESAAQDITSELKRKQIKLKEEREESLSKILLLLDTATNDNDDDDNNNDPNEKHQRDIPTSANSKSKYEELQIEKDESFSKLRIMLDTTTKDYENKIKSLEQTLAMSYSEESVDHAVEKALEMQKITMMREKDDAVMEAVSRIEQMLTVELRDLARKEMEEALVKQREELEREKNIAVEETVTKILAKHEKVDSDSLEDCEVNGAEETQSTCDQLTLETKSDLDELQDETYDAAQNDSESRIQKLNEQIESLEQELEKVHEIYYSQEHLDKALQEALEKQKIILMTQLKGSANEDTDMDLSQQRQDASIEKEDEGINNLLAEKTQVKEAMEQITNELKISVDEKIKSAVDEALQQEREANEKKVKELLKEVEDTHAREIKNLQMKIGDTETQYSENKDTGEEKSSAEKASDDYLLKEKDSIIEGLLEYVELLKKTQDKHAASSSSPIKNKRNSIGKEKKNRQSRGMGGGSSSNAQRPTTPREKSGGSVIAVTTPTTNDHKETTKRRSRQKSLPPNETRKNRRSIGSAPNNRRIRSSSLSGIRRSIGEIVSSGTEIFHGKRYSSSIQPFSTMSTDTVIDPSSIRLMIVNVPITAKMKKMAKSLKIELLDDAIENCTKVTHVIAGDDNFSLRRTPKLMVCLCCTSYVLHLDWLLQSYEQKSVLNPTDHLLIHDELAERRYRFSMRLTLKNGSERREEGGLFAGWSIFFCRGVAGNNAPKEEELNLIVKAAGGTIITYSDLPLSNDRDRAHVLVITNDPATKQQAADQQAAILAKNGAGFYTTTWLFGCVIHQMLFSIKRGLGPVRVSSITSEVKVEEKSLSSSDNDDDSDSSCNRKTMHVSFREIPRNAMPTDSGDASVPPKKEDNITTEFESTAVPEDGETGKSANILDTLNDAGDAKEAQTDDEFAFESLCERWKVAKNVIHVSVKGMRSKSDTFNEESHDFVTPDNPEDFAYGKLHAHWKAISPPQSPRVMVKVIGQKEASRVAKIENSESFEENVEEKTSLDDSNPSSINDSHPIPILSDPSLADTNKEQDFIASEEAAIGAT